MAKKLFFIFLSLLFSTQCFAKTKNENNIIADKIANIARQTNTIIGVSAVYIEDNKKISYNGTVPFFMASTAKVPIALTLLNRVDEHQETLDHVIRLHPINPTPGSGGLCYLLDKSYLNVSLMNLLKLMLMKSDNSASDAILNQVYGPTTVQNRLNSLGLNDIKVSRSFLEIFFDVHGADPTLMKDAHTTEGLGKIFNHVPLSKKMLAWKQLENDTRDTTTPNDMAQLLVKLYKGQLLSPKNTKVLIDIMEKCKTGKSRIKKLLPADTKVAHKTGTWSIKLPNSKTQKFYGYASDVGIITLPKNKGHIAVAIYVKSTNNGQARNTAIALVSRALYDYFTTNTQNIISKEMD